MSNKKRTKPRVHRVYTLKSPAERTMDYVRLGGDWWSVYKYYRSRAAAKAGVKRLNFLFPKTSTTFFQQPSGRVVPRKITSYKRVVLTSKGWAVVQSSSERGFKARERRILDAQLR